MNAEDYRILILRDLAGLALQLKAYPDESMLWQKTPGIGNAPGNIALHIAGNLQTYIGTELGQTGYVRDRDAEFARRDVPLATLLAELEAASSAVDDTLRQIDAARMPEAFPVKFGQVQPTTQRFLAHLCTHLAYHLGQVDYHRRITTGDGALEAIQSLAPLGD